MLPDTGRPNRRRPTSTGLWLFAAIVGAAALLLLRFGPGPGDADRRAAESAPNVDHGPEPTIGGLSGGQVVATGNFWADDPETPPERLADSVSISDLKNLAVAPRITDESSVRDGKRYGSVVLDFPYGAVTDDSSIDLSVKVTNRAGRAATSTITIDRN